MRIIFYQGHNRPLRHDGQEFEARAKDCERFWSDHIVRMYPLPKGSDVVKRAYVLQCLQAFPVASVDRVGIFCHGSRKWVELGITPATMGPIVSELQRILTHDARVGLYCCLCGHDVQNGMAVALSRALPTVHIMAHRSSSAWGLVGGHTVDNPYKRMFLDGASTDLWPTDKAAFRAYRDHLKTSRTFEFEMLEAPE